VFQAVNFAVHRGESPRRNRIC